MIFWFQPSFWPHEPSFILMIKFIYINYTFHFSDKKCKLKPPRQLSLTVHEFHQDPWFTSQQWELILWGRRKTNTKGQRTHIEKFLGLVNDRTKRMPFLHPAWNQIIIWKVFQKNSRKFQKYFLSFLLKNTNLSNVYLMLPLSNNWRPWWIVV